MIRNFLFEPNFCEKSEIKYCAEDFIQLLLNTMQCFTKKGKKEAEILSA